MTAQEFDRIGRARWGLDWKAPMARYLGIGKRKVLRWAAGTEAIPPWVLVDLQPVVEEINEREGRNHV